MSDNNQFMVYKIMKNSSRPCCFDR